MLRPSIAPVRPRVISPVTGDVLLLEDVVGDMLAERRTGRVGIIGGPGSGKRTALRHLAAVLSQREEWREEWGLRDALDAEEQAEPPRSKLVLFLSQIPPQDSSQVALRLAPWGQDELIEYLLSRHPATCRSVMARVGHAVPFDGVPQLCSLALDELAADESLPDPAAAILRHVRRFLMSDSLCTAALRFSLLSLIESEHVRSFNENAELRAQPDLERLLCHRPAQLVLAKTLAAEAIRSNGDIGFLYLPLPHDLILSCGEELAADAAATRRLAKLLKRKQDGHLHAMAASLLHAADPAWKGPFRKGVDLGCALLDGADWPGVSLTHANLTCASLRGARLREAFLDHARLAGANLSGADLCGASLLKIEADTVQLLGANLTGAKLAGARLCAGRFDDACLEEAALMNADLSGAQFNRTSLRRADLTGAKLVAVQMQDCDFSGANFKQANLSEVDLRSCTFHETCFEGAQMERANLEDVAWRNARLAECNLTGAHLTGSRFPDADLKNARLVNAGLAEIEWDGADLRGADLTGASFHLGSTRSGLLFSPYASEGSKTGFYTDDEGEQYFKPPEEIRKASLRRADLRGATLTDVDFYLVDLRGARLDDDQLGYVKSRGAIVDPGD